MKKRIKMFKDRILLLLTRMLTQMKEKWVQEKALFERK